MMMLANLPRAVLDWKVKHPVLSAFTFIPAARGPTLHFSSMVYAYYQDLSQAVGLTISHDAEACGAKFGLFEQILVIR